MRLVAWGRHLPGRKVAMASSRRSSRSGSGSWLVTGESGSEGGRWFGCFKHCIPETVDWVLQFFFSVVPLVRRVLFLLEGLLEALLEPF